MENIGFLPLLWWSLGAASLVGACVYLYVEYQAYLLRTSVSGITGGLRFTSRLFVAEARYGAKQFVVEARNAQYTRCPLPQGSDVLKTGAVTATLPAAGLKVQVFRMMEKGAASDASKDTGWCSIVLTASDELMMQASHTSVGERAVLRLDRVPASIAADFQSFSNTLQAWLGKVEHGLKMEIEAARLREEEAARAKEKAERDAQAAQATLAASAVLSDEQREARAAEQIAKWRESAGFTGNSSEVSVAPNGDIRWFIDLGLGGRVTLHANSRTFSGNLKGAEIKSLGTEVELGVRDEYWTEDEPHLAIFRILGDASPDVRRAWSERLEMMVQSLG
jgi:hypothetical protein